MGRVDMGVMRAAATLLSVLTLVSSDIYLPEETTMKTANKHGQGGPSLKSEHELSVGNERAAGSGSTADDKTVRAQKGHKYKKPHGKDHPKRGKAPFQGLFLFAPAPLAVGGFRGNALRLSPRCCWRFKPAAHAADKRLSQSTKP